MNDCTAPSRRSPAVAFTTVTDQKMRCPRGHATDGSHCALVVMAVGSPERAATADESSPDHSSYEMLPAESSVESQDAITKADSFRVPASGRAVVGRRAALVPNWKNHAPVVREAPSAVFMPGPISTV